MVLTSWSRCMLLLLVPLAIDAKLKEVEKECEGQIDCLHFSDCEPYKKALDQKKLLKKPSC